MLRTVRRRSPKCVHHPRPCSRFTITHECPQAFCQEAVIWKRLTHPNVVSLLGTTITPFQLVSDWMPGGDLLEYITKHNPNAYRLGLVCFPPPPQCDRHLGLTTHCQLLNIADGLRYLHACNVVHGDLKGVRRCSKFRSPLC